MNELNQKVWLLLSTAIWLAVLLTGCSGRPKGDAVKPILVHVAASTQNAMDKVAKQFSKETGLEVRINSASSNTLATQILAGAPGSVFLSASQEWMNSVEEGGRTEEVCDYLGGKLVLVVRKSETLTIKKPTDLDSTEIQRVAIAGEFVPAGVYGREALAKSGVWDSLTRGRKLVFGQDVRHTLSYVASGEADVGIVYQTDALISDQVKTVYTFPEELYNPIVYQLGLLKSSSSQGRRFFEYLKTPSAKKIFQEHGFLSK